MNVTVIYEPFKMLPLERFHDELLFDFPKLPVQLFDYYLLNTAYRMAVEGKILRRTAHINYRCGVTRYKLQSPDGLEITDIISVVSDRGCSGRREVPLALVHPDDLGFARGEYAWYDDDESVLHIWTRLSDGLFEVKLAVAPEKDACSLPAVYDTELYDTLMLGTKGRILMIPDRSWTDVRTGAIYMNEFEKRIVSHRLDKSLHKQNGAIRMSFGKAL